MGVRIDLPANQWLRDVAASGHMSPEELSALRDRVEMHDMEGSSCGSSCDEDKGDELGLRALVDVGFRRDPEEPK